MSIEPGHRIAHHRIELIRQGDTGEVYFTKNTRLHSKAVRRARIALAATMLMAGVAGLTWITPLAADTVGTKTMKTTDQTEQDSAAKAGPGKPATPKSEVAILAGGCFWGMEDLLRKEPGVLHIEVGYTGGWLDHPKYEDTHDSKSGHAEAVLIEFDPQKLSYGALLDFFFRIHDPTTKNRQGNDVGTQYRSAIFYTSEAQKQEAQRAIERARESGRWNRPITTEITPATQWWPAEDYHQDFLQKHPDGYTCHYIRD